jgi:hypothetical protein
VYLNQIYDSLQSTRSLTFNIFIVSFLHFGLRLMIQNDVDSLEKTQAVNILLEEGWCSSILI